VSQRGQRRRSERTATPPQGAPTVSAGARWHGFFLGQLLGATFGRFTNLVIAPILGFAAVFLMIAWQSGPQRAIDAARFSRLTGRADARILESWLAVEFNPSEMGSKTLWRPWAYASPCAVVSYQGNWGASQRRAFCGTRLKFTESYTIPDLSELAPHVPFAWMRDANGFAAPEIRMAPAAREWLASHPPHSTFGLPKPPPATALEELRLAMDRPIDLAIIGWGKPAPTIPLSVNPKNPKDAIPSGFVKDHWGPNWFAFAIAGFLGLLVWYEGMALLFGDLPRAYGYILLVLPLLGLPWWGEQFPRYLARFHKGFAGVIADMFQDIDPLGRLTVSEPQDATLAGGSRLIWQMADSSYADTLGRFRFASSAPGTASPDAAVAALAETVTAQIRVLNDENRTALFGRLREDKQNDRLGAGFLFLPAAREALIEPGSAPPVRRAAQRFLEAWFTQPEEPLDAKMPGYQARLAIYRTLTDVPSTEISSAAASIAGPQPKR
jgi:hypothetical protein